MLTKRQKQILDYVTKYIKKNDYAPSLKEIKKHFKLSSFATVHQHIENLETEGYLKKIENKPRSIELNKKKGKLSLVTIPLLGTIAAGQPIEAIEDKETIEVPKSQLSKSGEHFALRVSGNSMIDEGIFNGDTVVIRKQPTAENGETVVALINDNEVTLKKIYKEKNGFRLQPANPNLKPIFTKELTVQGKVVSVIRNFEELKNRIASPKIEIQQQKKNSTILNSFNSGKADLEKKTVNKFADNSGKHILYLGDCLDLLDQIENNSVQLVFADPPYNMGKKFGNNNDKWESAEEYKNWCVKWVEKCTKKLVSDGSIMIMGHPRFSSYLIPELDKRLIYTNQIIYHYTDTMPEKTNFERRYEVILYYRKDKKNCIFNLDDVRVPLVRYEKHSNPKGRNPGDVWQIHRVRWNSKERISLPNGKIAHVAQKPLKLMKRLILATTNKGDTMLDPFLGTGTTSVAAKELNRCSIGIELNPEYLKIALKRINDTKKGTI